LPKIKKINDIEIADEILISFLVLETSKKNLTNSDYHIFETKLIKLNVKIFLL